MSLADKIQLLNRYHSVAIDSKHKAQLALERANQEIHLLDVMLEEARRSACMNCSGYGLVREILAQDDVKTYTCSVCRGTGEKRETTADK